MYFTFKELISTQCGLENIPTKMEHVENLVCLADFLNEVREEFGEPIYVNSAYRTYDVNKRVGGVANSLHCVGRAADIRPCYVRSCDYAKNLQRLIDVIKTKKDRLSQFIPYSNFIHIAL